MDPNTIMLPEASSQLQLHKDPQKRLSDSLDLCSPLQLRFLGHLHQGYSVSQAMERSGITDTNVPHGWRGDPWYRFALAQVTSGNHKGAIGRDLARRIAIARAPHHVLALDELSMTAKRDSDKIAASDKVLQVADMFPRSQGAQVAIQVAITPATISPEIPPGDSDL